MSILTLYTFAIMVSSIPVVAGMYLVAVLVERLAKCIDERRGK